jgi:DNA polymerase (family 10)
MSNFELAALFGELADIMELAGENFFKIKAYRRAAETIAAANENISELKTESLLEMPGIGKAISEKIAAAKVNGTFPALEKWRHTGYATFLPMSRKSPILTIKALRRVIKDLGLKSFDDLKSVIVDGRLEKAEKLVQEIKAKIRELCK